MSARAKVVAVDERQYRSSSHREKVVEHVFLGELLRYLWVQRIEGVQVLKPEVDAAGYDLVLALGTTIRHVQLKTMMKGGKAQSQPVHESLAAQPSGCVVWIVLNEDLSFDHFRWYGEAPGRALEKLVKCKHAKHNRANAQGIKQARASTRSVPKSAFEPVVGMEALVQRLFGVAVAA